ncbi:MAG TPA: hypothetical protein VGN17_31660 [Bryobacteraceae bacterium]|jgi:hypothetical protein
MRSLSGLALLHFAANTLLLWLGYYWLGLSDSQSTTLLWSVVIALFAAILACSAYGASLAYFSGSETARPLTAWRTAVRHLVPMLVLAVAIAILYGLLALWSAYSAAPAVTIASYLTLTFRKPVRPSAVQHVFDAILWLVRWVILPALLLPVVSNAAHQGWSGLGGLGVATRRWWYWIQAPLLLLAAVWLPLKLLRWIPSVNGFGQEAASFVVRAGIAYLLFVGAWLALAFVTSAGKPRVTQPSTVPSP